MSDRTELRAAVQLRMGNRTDATIALVDEWINDGLMDLATSRIHIRELERTGSTVTSDVGVAAYSAPTDAFTITHLNDGTNSRTLQEWTSSWEDLLEAYNAEAPTTADIPSFFFLRGNQFFVFNTPQVDTIVWTPYYYARPAIGANPNDTPDINVEWHYAIKLMAALHGFRDLGDEERAVSVQGEFDAWLARRDTSRRHATRFKTPHRGIRPNSRWLRPSKTGV